MLKLVVGARSRARLLGALLVAGMGALGSSPASAQVFRSGDLVVSSYGTFNGTLLDGQPATITLVEYSPNGGSPISTFALPTNDAVGGSSNVGVVGEYGSSSEGNIQPSGNGQYLSIGGYWATPSFAGTGAPGNNGYQNATTSDPSGVALAQSTDTNVPRVGVLIDAFGNVNSSTVFNDLYNTNNPRSVYSTAGSTIYISGQGDKSTSDQGIFYAPVGLNTTTSSSTPTGIYNTKDTRYVTAYGGNLYYSLDKSGSPTGIFEFAGLPITSSTANQITAASSGSGASKVNFSPEGFFFANATTIYVADTGVPKAGGTGAGGIQKWVYNGSSWNLQYIFANPSNFVAPSAAATATSGETGFEAVTGKVSGNTVQLFGVSYTAGDDNPDGLYTITDTLSATTAPSQTLTELESAPGNGGIVFKGVTFALTPPTATDTPTLPQWGLILLAISLLLVAGWFLPKRAKLAGL